MVRRSKWENRRGKGTKTDTSIQKEGIIKTEEPMCEYNEVLKRSLVGKFSGEATMSDVRKWSLSTWKQTYSLSVYEMGNNFFLFECNSMEQVVQIMEGSWEWKKNLVILNWWNPLATTIEGLEEIDSTWVRIIGLPCIFGLKQLLKPSAITVGGG